MIDERRLNYTGAVVKGLNDGIFEITGEVAVLTFVIGFIIREFLHLGI
jgi:hypothetical protein